MAVLKDLGSFTPCIHVQTFLDHLAPPQPDFDLNATIRSLQSGSEPVLSSSNRWSMFPKDPKDSQGTEDEIFRPMPELFMKVVAAIVANSGGKLTDDNRSIDFLQNPRRAPTSAVRRNESRPDGYFVIKDRDKTFKDGKEDIHWADIVLPCEYKRKDGTDDLNDVCIHQGVYYLVLG
jgi:hypothetical protein